jgi:hypothetical protein
MNISIYYEGRPGAYDDALESELGFESTDAGTYLAGPIVRDIMWRGVPDNVDRDKVEEIASRICGLDLIKIEYVTIETRIFRQGEPEAA